MTSAIPQLDALRLQLALSGPGRSRMPMLTSRPAIARFPQRLAAELLMAAIAGNAPAAHFLELRMPKAANPAHRQRFVPVREVARAAALAIASADEGDVFVGCAPRTSRSGGADAVAESWTISVDCDTLESLERARAFAPPASVIVRSGSGGGHIWHQLGEAVPRDDITRVNRRVAHHVGADMVATDVARVLRVPGTLNHKTDPPRPVICDRLELHVYTAGEVVGHLPDPPANRPAAIPRPPAQLDQGDALLQIPASVYVPSLLGRPLGRDGKLPCPFHEDRTPSLHVYPGDGGWVCFAGCGGGTIIDFGSQLYGIEPRGRGYHDIRRRLAVDLLERVAA